MAKSRDAFRTISEVSEWLDIPAHVLRFWESRFSQIKPVKRAGGRRYYRPADMVLLGGIRRLLHDDGITIKGVQKILREKGVKYVSSLSLEAVAQPGTVAENDQAAAPVAEIRSGPTASETPEPEPAPVPEPGGQPGPAEPLPAASLRAIVNDHPEIPSVSEIGPDARAERIAALYHRLRRLRDRVQSSA